MGTVYLLGAGPGDPELLTVKAARILSEASIVLYDSLVSAEILQLIPKTAERIDVGKRAGRKWLSQADINGLLVEAAARHEVVVRLKGGDPLLFGRASEEIDALQSAHVAFEIVPGISAAFGAAASAKISLTDRRLASHVLFTTFSRAPEAAPLPNVGLTPETTVVVYMPGPDMESGFAPETPCVAQSNATRAGQQIHRTTITGLRTLPALPAPALLLVGRVAGHSATAAESFALFGEIASQHLPSSRVS
jgi:uroporphyrin-III C-methyltransferase